MRRDSALISSLTSVARGSLLFKERTVRKRLCWVCGVHELTKPGVCGEAGPIRHTREVHMPNAVTFLVNQNLPCGSCDPYNIIDCLFISIFLKKIIINI